MPCTERDILGDLFGRVFYHHQGARAGNQRGAFVQCTDLHQMFAIRHIVGVPGIGKRRDVLYSDHVAIDGIGYGGDGVGLALWQFGAQGQRAGNDPPVGNPRTFQSPGGIVFSHLRDLLANLLLPLGCAVCRGNAGGFVRGGHQSGKKEHIARGGRIVFREGHKAVGEQTVFAESDLYRRLYRRQQLGEQVLIRFQVRKDRAGFRGRQVNAAKLAAISLLGETI